MMIGILWTNLAYAEDEADKTWVELTYVEWSSEVASANVIKVVLEELDYEVELIAVSAAVMWQAVASGDVDGHVAAWLQSTHAHYLNAVKNKVENLGPNLVGTKIGLVVPQYVTINAIDELKANQFNKKIIGIDPGAGLMSKTEQVMEAYQLKDFRLMEGSGATMAAALGDAIKNKRWIVVTGWTPHWMFSRWDLKYLNDPKRIYAPSNNTDKGEEYISTIVRKGLKEDKPGVYQVLDNFHWKATDMEQIMIWNEEKNADPYQNAKRWVEENRDKVEKWKSP
ncbi:MAG: glycine/betaine ABC transporter substrate-binding protein [Gammaproteobacteria bacterium]|nr:MAG: glycine/betaine ABC transporter substrate-binding protein [Gammaproteobacteria bacterium]RKZ42962.1 MAG: glycine/betaine ABC transporter substrate-binding protein [Gammaproteobacteria bacterium]RKZ74901.1 MAG: glycine/betaine ABC transporter substrate-binding protein [Gammaproteobacteria bacterium]